jgi:PAS domain S-box-containing protein
VTKRESKGCALALAAARREADQALRESEKRFRNLADHAPVMIWMTAPDGRCSYLGKSWYEFTGQTPETGLGFGWLDVTHPDDRNASEVVFLDANANQKAFRLEYRLRRRDGAYRWTINAAVPRFDESGTFLGFVGSVIDITERKDTETRREQLLEAERYARREAEPVNRMKDEFLATLSHELRTPLNAIVGWAQIIDREGLHGDEIRKGLAAINRNARAQTEMIEELLDMSRITSGRIRLDVQPVPLADTIDHAVQSAQPAATARGIRLDKSLDPRAGAVTGEHREPLDEKATARSERARLPEIRPRLDGLTILIVEDDDDARELLKRIVGDSGARVLTAASAVDALALLGLHPVRRSAAGAQCRFPGARPEAGRGRRSS